MIYQLTHAASLKALNNLGKVLQKGAAHAEARKFDVEVLLHSRLAPDQFNLIKQVQIACDTAKLAGVRLTGKPAPAHDDSEKSLPELQARIQDTLKYLNSLSEADYQGAEAKQVTTPRWEGKWLSGLDYAQWHVLPNLYFHVTTAYSILRHNGVDVGKKDYLGELPFQGK
jgi:hypothetical protein